jgi:hypothetical protein
MTTDQHLLQTLHGCSTCEFDAHVFACAFASVNTPWLAVAKKTLTCNAKAIVTTCCLPTCTSAVTNQSRENTFHGSMDGNTRIWASRLEVLYSRVCVFVSTLCRSPWMCPCEASTCKTLQAPAPSCNTVPMASTPDVLVDVGAGGTTADAACCGSAFWEATGVGCGGGTSVATDGCTTGAACGAELGLGGADACTRLK